MIVGIIDQLDYLGIFLFMVAESGLIPILSEIVMPFAGFLISEGHLALRRVAFTGTIVNLGVLSLILGRNSGRENIRREIWKVFPSQ